ncbi:hypothetical protein [Thalassolituus oleivorans]|jgi:hypothetical protein|uniref:hypothetical protein n=1 Tax=Thalassolituus oleivorans TaxID=187493 RepID=UPI0030C8582C
MNTLRSGHWAKQALVALMLCSVLLQIQTVFACQMMDHSGPIEHCCCDDMASQNGSDAAQTEPAICCDIHTELTLKAVDVDGDEPVILTSHSSLDPPPATMVFLLVTLWPELVHASPSPVVWDLASKPAHPGTSTWLSTLRLRI